MKENGREQGKNRQRCGEEVRERAGHGWKEGAVVLMSNAVNYIESGLEKRDNTKQCRDSCDVERTRAIEKS